MKWVETCFCATPLDEEREYWEPFFELVSVKDAHARSRCRHESGEEYLGLLELRLHRPARGAAAGEGATFSDAGSGEVSSDAAPRPTGEPRR